MASLHGLNTEHSVELWDPDISRELQTIRRRCDWSASSAPYTNIQTQRHCGSQSTSALSALEVFFT